MTVDLAGRRAVVTGGTRGVGAGIARALLDAGAEVVVCARRPPERPVAAGGRAAAYAPLDLRDTAAVRDFFGGLDRLDVLVNNAGGTPYRRLGDAPAERHARVLDLNLTAPLVASLAAYEVMRRQERGGSIVMVGSVAGSRPSPGTAAYGAAKAGLAHLAGSMAMEWAPLVRVNTVAPGMVRTELAREHYGSAEEGEEGAGIAALAATVPAGRLAEPYEVGEAAVFLASDRAAYVTGAQLVVHGGGEELAFRSSLRGAFGGGAG